MLSRTVSDWPEFPFRMPLVGSKKINETYFQVLNEFDFEMEFRTYKKDSNYIPFWNNIPQGQIDQHGISFISIADIEDITKVELRSKWNDRRSRIQEIIINSSSRSTKCSISIIFYLLSLYISVRACL